MEQQNGELSGKTVLVTGEDQALAGPRQSFWRSMVRRYA